MRKHREKIILRPVRGLDRGALLFERRFRAPPLCHAGRERHRGDGGQDVKALQEEKGLILILPHKGTVAVQGSPNRDRRKNEKPGGSFAGRKTERSPDDDRSQDKCDRII